MTVRECSDALVTLKGGAQINVAEWPGTQGPLVCVHGLTSSSRCFAGLATELPDCQIYSIDLRGRGASSKTPPFGIEQHADDVAEVMERLDLKSAVMLGHSMGAYVLGAVAAKYPELVKKVVFIDGGYWAPDERGMSAQEVFTTKFGVFMTKLQRSWASVDEYFDFYAGGPLYPSGVDEYGRAHFAYDLEGEPPAMQARISAACIHEDWLSLNDSQQVLQRLESIKCPALLLLAPGGLTGTGDAVIEPKELREMVRAVRHLRTVEIPDSNHHTILTSRSGAQACAKKIGRFLQAATP